MPVTAWTVEHNGDVWGADGTEIVPAALAVAIAEHEGEERYTYYGKPYTLKAGDPQSVFDYFGTEVDPHGDRVIQRWEYEPEPESTRNIIP